MENDFNLMIRVVGEDGEECMSIHKIGKEEVEFMIPFLEELESRGGYYPTGDYFDEEYDIDPDKLYSNFQGYDQFNKYLPMPISGFKEIEEVIVYKEISRLSMQKSLQKV